MLLNNELTRFGLDHSLRLPIRSLGGFKLPRSECECRQKPPDRGVHCD